MLKIEKFVTASPEQWEIIIEGMRNPLNSWDKMDSGIIGMDGDYYLFNGDNGPYYGDDTGFFIGDNDYSLMARLDNAGTEDRKFMRMIPVWVTLSAPLYWWKEADTYKVGTTRNSCSTMHKIQAKEFTLDDFSCEHLRKTSELCLKEDVIAELNFWRDIFLNGGHVDNFNGTETVFPPKCKDAWWQMIQLLPSSYNQKATLFLNYEVLSNMYHQRKNHKLDEWHTFCDWIRELPYSELIMREFE